VEAFDGGVVAECGAAKVAEKDEWLSGGSPKAERSVFGNYGAVGGGCEACGKRERGS
jgi:hypothetical protein